jgi:uncharacterized protein DUF3179
MELGARGGWRRRWVRIAAGGGIGAIAVVAGLFWLAPDRAAGRPVELLKLQPVIKPPVTPAASTWLPDHAPVIGVTVRDRHRAYATTSFTNIDEHVVNDVVGGRPITVAYCNRTGCTKVYTGSSGNQPLDVAVGGWVGDPGSSANGVMLLRVGADYYLQDSGDCLSGWGRLPYSELAFEQTTWGAWRRAHPDTDVVTGPKQNLAVEQ